MSEIYPHLLSRSLICLTLIAHLYPSKNLSWVHTSAVKHESYKRTSISKLLFDAPMHVAAQSSINRKNTRELSQSRKFNFHGPRKRSGTRTRVHEYEPKNEHRRETSPTAAARMDHGWDTERVRSHENHQGRSPIILMPRLPTH